MHLLMNRCYCVDAQALKHVKSMKLVEGSYAAKEMALDKINALITIVEQSESQKEVSLVWIIQGHETGLF